MEYTMIVKIIATIFIASLIIGRKHVFKEIPLASYIYIIAWLMVGIIYACLWGCHFLFAFIGFDVHMEYFISNNRWIIQSITYALFVLFMLNGNSVKSSKGKPYKNLRSSPAGAAGVTASGITGNRDSIVKTSNHSVNINNIKNKVSSGTSISLDWSELSLSDMFVIIDLAKKSGANITITNIKTIKNKTTIDNMIQLASKAPGQVIYETPIEASFNALQLAKSGAHFVCDNSMGSSLVNRIILAAQENHGHVTFIKCSKRSQDELLNLKKQYSRYMNFS